MKCKHDWTSVGVQHMTGFNYRHISTGVTTYWCKKCGCIGEYGDYGFEVKKVPSSRRRKPSAKGKQSPRKKK